MVVVFGTVCLDRLHQVPRLPKPGGYVEIGAEEEIVGGEAVNSALALSSWGVDFRFHGNPLPLGRLRKLLEARGLDTSQLAATTVPEPACDIYVTPDGQRTMFGRGFAELEAVEFDPTGLVGEGDWFTVDGNFGGAGARFAARARELGARVYLEDILEPLGPFEFWQSSTDWVGRRGQIQKNVQWLQEFLDARDGFGVLSDGENGFVAGGVDHRGQCRPIRHYPPFPSPGAIDSTGAGDVFRAGMLRCLDRGLTIAESLRFASAAGSLNCRSLGANTGLPTVAEVEALIDAHPEVAKNYE